MQLPRLKEWRKRRLLTQAELAERAGLSKSHYSRIENCLHSPRFSTIRKLAEALGVPPDELMAGPKAELLAAG